MRSPNSTPGIGQRDRAGGENHRLGLVGVAVDDDVAVRVERSLALDLGDLVLLPQHLDAARERLRDLGAARAERLPVQRRALDREPELGRVLGVVEELGGVEHRLRRDAGVVEAAAAGLVALDHRGLLAQLGGANRGDVAAGTAPDHDHVIRIGHTTTL